MHVGVYARNLEPTAGGGFTFEQEVVESLAELAPSSNHRFTILSSGSGKAPGRDLGIPTVAISQGRGLGRAVRAAEWFVPSLDGVWDRMSSWRRVVRRLELDFVWFAGSYFAPVDVPYLAVIWDLQFRRQPWFPEVSAGGTWATRQRYYGQMLQRASVVIAGTNVGQREIERYFGIEPERIHLLPHPTPRFALEAADGTTDYADKLKELGLEPGYLFYPAQFWPHKNHIGLLRALHKLRRESGWTPTLVLVGSDKGVRGKVTAEAERLGVSDQLRVLGFVPTDTLAALYRGALALTYVTFFGPENLPPLEAFALGCPVIATNVAGASEQLGDAALLVPPGDDKALAQAILQLSRDGTLRERLIERGRVRARAWTGPDYVKGVLRILNDFETFRRCW